MSAAETWDDLDETLAGPAPDYGSEPESPQNADHANWLLRRLARARRMAGAAQMAAQVERDHIDTWEAGRLAVIERETWHIEDSLAQYHRAVLSRDPRAKTIELPYGTLKARAQQPEWTVDLEAFIPWAMENAPELVRVPEPKPAPNMAAMKQATGGIGITADGERLPGVTVTEREPTFTASTGGEA